jgi:ParB family transcriptional regulator, chromosome partitioning protein
MNQSRKGLGKGLDALIPGGGFAPVSETASEGVTQVAVTQIVPNPRQPRAHFEPSLLEELAASIREHGIIQPLIVSRDERGEGYILVAGERRLQASRLAGLQTVPVIIRQTTDQQRLELALIENIQRADLDPLEEARAYRQLSEEFSLSHEAIATRVGKSRVAITNTLRLLKLPENIQQALLEGKISEGHARALLGLNTPEAMAEALKTIMAGEYTVRQTEELVRKLNGQKPSTPLRPEAPPEVNDLEERLRSTLGTKVTLRASRKGSGSLTIHYYSNEELEALLTRLLEEK